jgi:hypothetical protein
MKQLLLQNSGEADEYVRILRDTAHEAQLRVQEISEKTNALDFLEKLKYERIGCDPLDKSRSLNLIEQINQTFTYLASFRAAALLFQWHDLVASLTLNLGTAQGSDIESADIGGIAAEVFAATSPGSNQKLKKDISKVQGVSANHKYVFFMCPNIEEGRYETGIANGVTIWSLGL